MKHSSQIRKRRYYRSLRGTMASSDSQLPRCLFFFFCSSFSETFITRRFVSVPHPRGVSFFFFFFWCSIYFFLCLRCRRWRLQTGTTFNWDAASRSNFGRAVPSFGSVFEQVRPILGPLAPSLPRRHNSAVPFRRALPSSATVFRLQSSLVRFPPKSEKPIDLPFFFALSDENQCSNRL